MTTIDEGTALVRPRSGRRRAATPPDAPSSAAAAVGRHAAEPLWVPPAEPVRPEQTAEPLWVPPAEPLRPALAEVRAADEGEALWVPGPVPVRPALAARARAGLPKVPFIDIESQMIRYPRRKPLGLLWAVSLLLGWFGVDRLMTGRYATGALKALTLGGLGFWWAADLFSVAWRNVTDRKGVRYTGPDWAAALATGGSVLAVAVAAGIVAPALEPYAHELTRTVQAAVAPAPPPPPTWQQVLPNADGTGNGTSPVFTTHGGQVRLGAQAGALAYFWVEPVGKDETKDGSKPTVSIPDGGATTATLDLPAGSYRVAVVAEGKAHWMTFATELTPAAAR